MYIVADEYISFILVKWWETSFVFIFHVAGDVFNIKMVKIVLRCHAYVLYYGKTISFFKHSVPSFSQSVSCSNRKYNYFQNFNYMNALSRKGFSTIKYVPLDLSIYNFFSSLFDSILPYSDPDASYSQRCN